MNTTIKKQAAPAGIGADAANGVQNERQSDYTIFAEK